MITKPPTNPGACIPSRQPNDPTSTNPAGWAKAEQTFMLILRDSVMLKWFWQFQNNATETPLSGHFKKPTFQFVKPGGFQEISSMQLNCEFTFSMSFPWVLPSSTNPTSRTSLKRTSSTGACVGFSPSQLTQQFVHQPYALNVRRLFLEAKTEVVPPHPLQVAMDQKEATAGSMALWFQGFFPFNATPNPHSTLRQRWGRFLSPTPSVHACRRQQNV